MCFSDNPIYYLVLWDIHLEAELLCHMVALWLTSWGNIKLFSMVSTSFLFLPAVYEDSSANFTWCFSNLFHLHIHCGCCLSSSFVISSNNSLLHLLVWFLSFPSSSSLFLSCLSFRPTFLLCIFIFICVKSPVRKIETTLDVSVWRTSYGKLVNWMLEEWKANEDTKVTVILRSGL